MSVAECTNSSAPFELSIASASISAVLLVITVPTNLLVCLAILVDPNRELRTQFNCFTFNLGLADLLVGCVAEPVSIYAHITEAFASEHSHEVSQVILKMFHIPYFISAMASVLSIAALACERNLAINSPLRYRKYFNVKLTLVFSTFIWVIAIIFGLLNLLFDYIFESFIFINSGVLFTGAIVCFVYGRIRSSLRKTSKQWTKNGTQRNRDIVTQLKLTKTFALMIGTLMLCYLPACSMVYFINLCTNCNCNLVQWFRDAVFWLVLLNSAINPYVYAVRSSVFRHAINKIVKCRCQHPKKPRTFPSIRYSKVRRGTYGALGTDGDLVSCQVEHA
ncbi:adenosine receptor A2a-like [Paramuricea clavata]|uniref:Adenosine receptor A2a-like n=1 Tax=Paramuricea clavata TaxID=317549 RepID=A0A6S7FK76_PARCT|nr:adenosine receptor A2a-like [Paramuricea clavata]